ncbi:MAG: hypothetical protein ACE5H1_04275 [Thermodesulfobacteriota bacterium]
MSKKQTKTKSKEDIGRVAEMAANMVAFSNADENPPLMGSRIRIWKQDPTVKGIGVRTTYVHTKVDEGPIDSQIVIKGLPIVSADSNGDFLFATPNPPIVDNILNPPPISEEDKKFDAAHTYAIVRKVLTMYQRVLGKRLSWAWNTNSNNDPLEVYPHANKGKRAFYERALKAIKFEYFFPVGFEPIFTCRSLDVVSHETGHAVLDSLKPNWGSSEPGSNPPPQIGALHESFGDLTSIFYILSQFDQVEYIIAQTKSDLHYQKNILATWSEQLEFIPGFDGPRNADNDLKLSEVGNEVHKLSQVFTGAVYDTLADVFSSTRDSRLRHDSETLYLAGQYMLKLILNAIISSPDSEVTFADVAKEMIKIAEEEGNSDYVRFIQNNFRVREVLTEEAEPTAFNIMEAIEGDFSNCCATFQSETS